MDLLTKTVEKCQEGTGKGSEVMQTQRCKRLNASDLLLCDRVLWLINQKTKLKC